MLHYCFCVSSLRGYICPKLGVPYEVTASVPFHPSGDKLEKVAEAREENHDLIVSVGLSGDHLAIQSMSDNATRSTFISNAVKLVRQLNLTGLHMGFKFPTNETTLVSYSHLIQVICKLIWQISPVIGKFMKIRFHCCARLP